MRILFTLILLASCSNNASSDQVKYFEPQPANPETYLYRFGSEYVFELREPCGYLNAAGDTVIEAGRFAPCISDTLKAFAMVGNPFRDGPHLIGINGKGQRLYDVFWFDNGPDYIVEGLFRIMRDSLIGYANTDGMIVIEPQFACAGPFYDGRAQVTFSCKPSIPEHEHDEHVFMESDEWFFIDKTGARVE